MHYTYRDFNSQIEAIWRKFANKTAIVRLENNGNRTYLKYEKLLGIGENLSKLMSDSGINRAERIAVIAPYSAQTAVLSIILAYTGYTAVIIDAALPISERNKLLDYADVSSLFTTEEIYMTLAQITIKNIPVFKINSNFSYSLFESSVKCVSRKISEPLNEDIIAILFSSGTTGTMKGVQITYNSILYAHKCMLKYTKLNSSATFLDVLPPNHIAGYSSVLSCVLTGTELGFIPEVSSNALSNALLEYNPTNFIMIPKIYEVIMNKIKDGISQKPIPVRRYAEFAMSFCGFVRKATGIKLRFLTKPVFQAAFGKNMKICGCGAAPCSKELIDFYLNLGIDFVNVYGSTETGFPIAAASCCEKYPDNGCGNVRQFSEISTRIANSDSHGIGEIRVKTPLIMDGYFKEPKLTADSFDENGYFKTGDTGYIDNNGYLYVTGRIKENIILPNGEKVSPADVDNYYSTAVGDYDIACKGIAANNGLYDEIHLFISTKNLVKEEQKAVIETLKKASNVAPSMFKLSGIHCIDSIPKTTLGKVKRFELEIPIIKNKGKKIENPHNKKSCDTYETIISILTCQARHYNGKLSEDLLLVDDLGFDSLTMFEIAAEIERQLHIDISLSLGNAKTVGDLISAANSPKTTSEEINTADYPVSKTQELLNKLHKWIKLSRKLYNFEISGLENISQNENYIICSNHINNLDPIWIITAMEGYASPDKIGSLAAIHLFKKKFTRNLCNMIGAIPVNRSGNTVPAMNRCRECLESGMSLIIFPEGARTVDGKMLPFKNGAAKLSIESRKPIVPVRIDGGFEIFPRHKKLPRIFNWKKLSKYTIKISFEKPVYPEGKNENELTEKLKNIIENIQ